MKVINQIKKHLIMSENTIKTREELKETFVTGAKPTQQDFHDWLDAYVHKNDEQAGSGQSGQQQGGDAITPMEQWLIASNPAYQSDGSGGGTYIYNTQRLPMWDGHNMMVSNIGTMQNNIVPRLILFHRGRFYDNAMAGRLLHIEAQGHYGYSQNAAVILTIDSNYYTLLFNPSNDKTEDDATFLMADSRTISMQGYTITITLDTANNNYTIVIQGSRSTIGLHTVSITGHDGMPLSLYGDLSQQNPAEYGSEDYDGYHIDTSNMPTGMPEVFYKLTNALNPVTEALEYYQIECLYCDESELEPGTYYRYSNNGEYWLEEVVVEETAE